MVPDQYIVICLKDFTADDPATYVQASRRRFSNQEAIIYAQDVAPSRDPRVVSVAYVRVDKKGYPIKNT